MKSVLRSTIKCHTVTTSGVCQPVCIFCGYERKKVNNVIEKVGQCETVKAEKAIKDADHILNEQQFLVKYRAVDFVAKGVKYHHSCHKNYLSRAERVKKIEKEEKTEYAEVRDAHRCVMLTLGHSVAYQNILKILLSRISSQSL